MPEDYKAERTISAAFKREEQVEQVIRQLLARNVPQDHISMMAKNLQSETRISGFITKKDIILGGLRQGGIFGSFFGTVLALLTGVGALWIPFVGWVAAAGPLGALLLGATSGAIAGASGAGLISALAAWGMPEDKAAIYETRMKAGEFLMMVEVPASEVEQFRLLLEGAGGEEIHVTEATLPRSAAGPYSSPDDLAPEVRTHLSEEAQLTFIERYNAVLAETQDPHQAEGAAWDSIHQQYKEDENGLWTQPKALAGASR